MLKPSCLCFLLALSIAASVDAQDPETDSLIRLVSRSAEDTNKVNLYRQIGAKIIYQNAREAIPWFNQGIALAKKLQFNSGLERCYVGTSLAYSFNAVYDTSLAYIDTAVYYARKVGNIKRLALVYLNRGDVYKNLQNFTPALKNLDTAIHFAERAGSKDGLARIYSIMSDIYSTQQQYPLAFANLDKSQQLFEEVHNTQMIGMSHFGRGELYQQINEPDKAAVFYKKAIHIADSVEDIQNLASYTYALASIYIVQKKFREAELTNRLSLAYADQTGHRKQQALAHDLFCHINMELKNYPKAVEEGRIAYGIMKDENDLLREKDCAASLADAYFKSGNPAEAYRYLKISQELNDSLVKQQFNDETAKLQTTFQVSQKDKEIQLLNKDKELQQQKLKQQRFILIGSLLLVALALLGIGLFINRNRLRQRMKELELRNQIAADLHDEVGSSLSSIHMLSQIATQQQGSDVKHQDILARMSSNAKETMDKMGDIVWMIKPGETESASLKQRMERFAYEMCGNKNIELEMDLDEIENWKLTMDQRKNIYLIFKESLNNAVKYSGTEKMVMSCATQNKELKLLVKDFGRGFETSIVKKGNGLYNMQNRAKELGGKIEIYSVPGKGTAITLVVPA